MSRIGKQPITIPTGVTFNFSKEKNKVTVKGPKGELHQAIDPDFTIKQEGAVISLERPTDQKRHKAMHGLYRALIANMIQGVSKGWRHQLELVGVGYKANAQSNVLELSLGYSHNVFYLSQLLQLSGYLSDQLFVDTFQDNGRILSFFLNGLDLYFRWYCQEHIV